MKTMQVLLDAVMQNMDDGIYDITTGTAECLPT
jgi:hypothetical protein